jgi:hypothetical protein
VLGRGRGQRHRGREVGVVGECTGDETFGKHHRKVWAEPIPDDAGGTGAPDNELVDELWCGVM